MAQRRHHYELAFEAFLRARRVPYVAVDEARRALLPDDHSLRITTPSDTGERTEALKSFDFVIYGPAPARDGAANLLVEVKGRKIPRARRAGRVEDGQSRDAPSPRPRPAGRGRLESWVTVEDVESLRTWERLFGAGFAAAFVFVYWCDEQPPDGLFQEVFEHRGRWYAVRAVRLGTYAAHMKMRSPRWGTVHLPADVFERVSQPFAGRVDHV